MTCGKEKDGTDWSSVRVKYTMERHVHGPMFGWAEKEPSI